MAQPNWGITKLITPPWVSWLMVYIYQVGVIHYGETMDKPTLDRYSRKTPNEPGVEGFLGTPQSPSPKEIELEISWCVAKALLDNFNKILNPLGLGMIGVLNQSGELVIELVDMRKAFTSLGRVKVNLSDLVVKNE